MKIFLIVLASYIGFCIAVQCVTYVCLSLLSDDPNESIDLGSVEDISEWFTFSWIPVVNIVFLCFAIAQGVKDTTYKFAAAVRNRRELKANRKPVQGLPQHVQPGQWRQDHDNNN
jgi:hypothetical protein